MIVELLDGFRSEWLASVVL